jgi:hypothetical protein
VLYNIINDKLYLNQLTDYERNILKWAGLLHDISKRGKILFKGEDHIHPFNSGLATL